MSDATYDHFAKEQIDRVAIADLIQCERISRDMRRWPQMEGCYAEDSFIDIAWIQGSGKHFVSESQRMVGKGLRTFHETGPSRIQIKGDRAIADTATIVHMIGAIDDIDVDIVCHARMFTRVVRRDGCWLIHGIRSAYLQDMMIPLDPTRIPQIDLSDVADFPSSYRVMSHMLKRSGLPAWPEQPGMDRPETVLPLIEGEEVWLAGQ